MNSVHIRPIHAEFLPTFPSRRTLSSSFLVRRGVPARSPGTVKRVVVDAKPWVVNCSYGLAADNNNSSGSSDNLSGWLRARDFLGLGKRRTPAGDAGTRRQCSGVASPQSEPVPFPPATPQPGATPEESWQSKLNNWGLIYVNFILGVLLSLPLLPTRLILMDYLNVGPALSTVLHGWVNVPWALKPFYGFFSDSYAIFGLHRLPYLALGLLLSAACYAALATPVPVAHGLKATMALLLISSTTLAVAQVSADALIVDAAKLEPESESGTLQSTVFMAQSIGSCVASLLSGVMLDRGFSAEIVMFFCALFCLSGLPVLFTSKETPRPPTSGLRNESGRVSFRRTMEQVLVFWRSPEIWRIALFMTLFTASPTAGDTMFYFFRNKLGFSMGFMGLLEVLGYAAAAGGSWWYQRSLRFLPQRQLISRSVLTAFCLGMTSMLVVLRWNLRLGIPDRFFVFGDKVAMAICANVAWMPLLVQSARAAPGGAEGTAYQTIIGLWNVCSIVSDFLGGMLAGALGVTADDYSRLWLLVLVCNLTTLLPLPLLGVRGMIPSVQCAEKDDEDEVVKKVLTAEAIIVAEKPL